MSESRANVIFIFGMLVVFCIAYFLFRFFNTNFGFNLIKPFAWVINPFLGSSFGGGMMGLVVIILVMIFISLIIPSIIWYKIWKKYITKK